MDNVEQLKQDNAKLQERLNNAAKFFREQKAQIDSLTNEVKEKTELALDYRNQIESLTKENNGLKSNIDSKDKAYKILQETYNEVFAENKQLKEQVESSEFNAESDANNLEDLNKQLNEYELKLQNSEAAYEMLRKKYEERKNQIAELSGNIEIKNNEYNELKKLHDGDLKRYNELEDNYESLQNKYKENDIAKGEAELKAQSLNDEYTKKFAEQETQIESLKKKFEEEGKNAVANKVLLDEANEKIEKLNKLYTDCENEKLGAQADYENLKEQFEHIKIQEEANREAAAQAEELYEECEKYRNFIRALSQLTKTVNIEWLSPNEMNDDQKKVLNEVTTPKKEQTINKDTKKVENDKGKNFREQDFPLMSM